MLQSSPILQREILAVTITIDILLSDARRYNEEGRDFGPPPGGKGNKNEVHAVLNILTAMLRSMQM